MICKNLKCRANLGKTGQSAAIPGSEKLSPGKGITVMYERKCFRCGTVMRRRYPKDWAFLE